MGRWRSDTENTSLKIKSRRGRKGVRIQSTQILIYILIHPFLELRLPLAKIMMDDDRVGGYTRTTPNRSKVTTQMTLMNDDDNGGGGISEIRAPWFSCGRTHDLKQAGCLEQTRTRRQRSRETAVMMGMTAWERDRPNQHDDRQTTETVPHLTAPQGYLSFRCSHHRIHLLCRFLSVGWRRRPPGLERARETQRLGKEPHLYLDLVGTSRIQ
jgi:hypothetical protein